MLTRRSLLVSGAVAIIFFVSGCTPAPIRQITFRDATLGLQGAGATLPLDVTCQPGWNLAFGSVNLAQADPPRLAQGFGTFENVFPGVPCTGSAQTLTVTVFNTSPWVFKRGTAAASGSVTVFDPETGELITESAEPQEIQIRQANSLLDSTQAVRPT